MRRQLGAREISSDNAGNRLQEASNPGRDRIELDIGHEGGFTKRLRHQGGKQPGADARFEDAAAAPAEPFETRPDRPDDELGREMGILRAAGKRSVIRLVDGCLQIFTQLFPTLAEPLLARPGEDRICEVGRTEAGEPDQPGLLG